LNVILAWQSFKNHLGEDRLKRFLNFTMHALADIDIPIKRGTFIEFRNGMLNISPIGRNCAQDERDDFDKYDAEHKVDARIELHVRCLDFTLVHRRRLTLPLTPWTSDPREPDRQTEGGVQGRRGNAVALPSTTPRPHLTCRLGIFAQVLANLRYSIGGQISFDVFPEGWDKTYCLRFIEEFDTVHFFGDKTFEGGNDYEIYESERTQGHAVKCPDDTLKLLDELFFA